MRPSPLSRAASLALLWLLGLGMGLGCGWIMAMLIAPIALDQPSIASLAQDWGLRWGVLLGSISTAAALLPPPKAARLSRPTAAGRLQREAGLLGGMALMVLALAVLIGAGAAALEQLGWISWSRGFPHAAWQTMAETMLQAADWSGIPAALAAGVMLKRNRPIGHLQT